MRPTLTQLRAWTPEALTGHAAVLTALSEHHLASVACADARVRDVAWTGVAAVAAAERSDREVAASKALSAHLDAVAGALREAAHRVGAARAAALALADEAVDRFGLRVTDSGRVAAPATSRLGGLLVTVLMRVALAELARIQDARLAAALDAVDAADRAAATALRGVNHASVPPGDASPEDNSRYWRRLTPAQRGAVLAEHPDWIGNRDGIPAAVRDTANRAVLEADRRGLADRIEEIRAAGRYRDPLGGASWWARAEVSAARARLDEIDSVARALDDPERRLLVYRGGAEVRAAVAVGDVDRADHVAVFTPGVNSTVGGDLGRYADALTRVRASGARQLGAVGRDESVATVVWMDYRAPQLDPAEPFDALRDAVVDLAGGAAARSGAESLASFLRGLTAARPGEMHLTAVGHSYGSTVTGLALQHGPAGVDDAVFLGSPGVGADDVTDLGLAPGRVYAADAPGDLIADLGVYGADPDTLAGVTVLPTAARDSLTGVTGHSGYLDPGSASLDNVAAVVAGLPG
ncbi:alpha/beta hydrolase [Rhodococcus sp. NPDC054953]